MNGMDYFYASIIIFILSAAVFTNVKDKWQKINTVEHSCPTCGINYKCYQSKCMLPHETDCGDCIHQHLSDGTITLVAATSTVASSPN